MNMESVFNRLRDTVSATVYQVTNNLSTALPGNPLTREYELVRQVGSAGTGLVFKIYEAVKKSTKEDAALFILEKKMLDKFSKKEKELLLESIRRGVAQLTRLRHPSMLTVQHNIEESRDLIAFATEPVLCSLANFLENNNNLDTNNESDSEERCKFFDVEIRYGLLQIAEGLVFLHKDAKILHRNLCPENIIVNRNGIWKIAGFEFSVPTTTPNEQPYQYPPLTLLPDTLLDVQPNFTYAAPEYFREAASVDASADIFSLGMLTYSLYNQGTPLCAFTQNFLYSPGKFAAEVEVKLSSNTCLLAIPEDSRKHVKLLLSFDTSLRPDAQQISKLQIFQDVLVRTLQYFDSLFQWDNAQKAQFYKNLPEILPQMPKRVQLRRIVSGLSKEFVNPEMVPFVLPNVIQIAKDTNDDEFHTWIVPDLVPVFKYKEPIQIGIYLLQNMEFLVLKFKTKPDSLREHIIPLIYRFLESDAHQIQELCLHVIPTVIHLIDYSGMKNMLLPRIKKLVFNTKLLSVRVNCLVCLGKIVESLDKWLVLDEVLSLVMQMPSREPAVIMSSIGILKLILTSNKLGISKELLATKVIPFLVPLSIENGLSLQQYNTVMLLIREMLCKVEEEHQSKLQQLESIKVQQDSFFQSNSENKSIGNTDLFSMNSTTSVVPPFAAAPPAADKSNFSGANGLTLDDKERLAFQKEQMSRFNNEKPLFPEKKSLTASSSPTSRANDMKKDLTSTLINSNLNMLPSNLSNSSQNEFGAFPLSNTSTVSSFSAVRMATNLTSKNSSLPITSAFDSLVIPDLKQKSNPQSLNTLKMSTDKISLTSNNFNSFHHAIPVTNSNQNYSSGSATTQAAKQLSNSELEEFLN